MVLATLRRITRCPAILQIGQAVTARSGGDPGVTGVPLGSAWDWRVLAIERARASIPPRGSVHVAVVARLASDSTTPGTTGDGRNVLVEDWMGRRFRPLYKLLHGERQMRRMPEPDAQILPGESFDTVWVYELPAGARVLRLLLPFDDWDLPFELAA